MQNGCINIDGKYETIKKIGEGAYSKVYLAQDIKTKAQYAIKMIKDENDKISQNTFCNEHNILEILNNLNSKYFPHLYEYKERGRIRYHNDRIAYKDYIVTDYFCKGNLLIYIEQTGKGLEEKYAKVIFSEILKGVKKFHTEKICHLDLHMRNILLNENFKPRIIDFGISHKLKSIDEKFDSIGAGFQCPEMNEKNNYNGIDADIFSLGSILFSLVTSKYGFHFRRFKNDDRDIYNLIKDNKLEQYWDKIINSLENKNIPTNFSKEFKDLFISMVAYDPKKRPRIDEILNSPWFKEINNLSQDEYEKLENEMSNYFLKLEEKIEEANNMKNNSSDESASEGNRGLELDNCKLFFDLNIEHRYIRYKGINAQNYIYIDGKLDPVKFMNKLVNIINKKFCDNCLVKIVNKKKLKFNAIFYLDDEDENEEKEINDKTENIDNNNNIKIINNTKQCIICIKLFKYMNGGNGGHVVHFVRKAGNFEDYYEYFLKIKEIIKSILKF